MGRDVAGEQKRVEELLPTVGAPSGVAIALGLLAQDPPEDSTVDGGCDNPSHDGDTPSGNQGNRLARLTVVPGAPVNWTTKASQL